jgi:hypothetical protein
VIVEKQVTAPRDRLGFENQVGLTSWPVMSIQEITLVLIEYVPDCSHSQQWQQSAGDVRDTGGHAASRGISRQFQNECK